AHAREGGPRLGAISLVLHAPDAVDLPALDLERYAQELGRPLLGDLVAVHAHHGLLVPLELLLVVVGGLGDLALRVARLDGAHHTPELVDPLEVSARLSLEAVGKGLDRPAAAERIDRVRDAALLAQDLLRAEGYHHGLLGGEREGLVERVRVQRLHPAQDAGERLHGHAHAVVERLLRGERDPRGLRVGAEAERALVASAEAVAHDRRPQAARGPQLRHLLQAAVVEVEAEGEPRREAVDREAARETRLAVRGAGGGREGGLLDGGGSRAAGGRT